MSDKIDDKYNIRFIRLHFTAELLEDTTLPKYKTSALRGGMGEMLLSANCVKDRNCENCDFESECIIRRTMYSKFNTIRPSFLPEGSKESAGYILSCEDYKTEFNQGDTFNFVLILFGKSIVYFNLYLQALYSLGLHGLGINNSRFSITQITNSQRQMILDRNNNIYMQNYKVMRLSDYVRYRLNSFSNQELYDLRIDFRSPLTINYRNEILNDFQMRPIIESAERRLNILNCFENKDVPMTRYNDDELPAITYQASRFVSVPRYSNRQQTKMVFYGINGAVEVKHVKKEILQLLLACEIINMGKNTSFGFGRIVVKEN